MAIQVIRQFGKGGYPRGRDASSAGGGAGYALTPTITDGDYGTGGSLSADRGNYDTYDVQSGGGGGIDVITVSVTPGEVLNITVGKGGAGDGVAGNQAGSAGAVSIWY